MRATKTVSDVYAPHYENVDSGIVVCEEHLPNVWGEVPEWVLMSCGDCWSKILDTPIICAVCR